MAFKEGVQEEHVHAFRALVTAMKSLDEQIDAGQVTPSEALDKAVDLINATGIPAEKKKKEKA